MKFEFVTIFPDVVHAYANESIIGRAQRKDLVTVKAHNLREYTTDKWKHVDDRPYGGGAGMILQIEPIAECLKSIKAKKGNKKSKIILLDPAGKKFDQKMATKLAKLDRVVFICGRYEGVDARVKKLIDERVSVGDFVLAGGELPALTIMEATARLVPGVLGNSNSLTEETTVDQKEYPQYTRPENWQGHKVPKVLLSGDHQKIALWRKKSSK